MNCKEKLQKYQEKIKEYNIVDFFNSDKKRAENYSIHFNDIYFDYSKNYINKDILNLLLECANQNNLQDKIKAMFSGEKINATENRAVLHIALRNFSKNPIFVDGVDVMPKVREVQQKMRGFVEKVHSGEWLGYTGKKIVDVVNIGIGGSHLGPAMVTKALNNYKVEGVNLHFISNIDADDIRSVFKKINPETTLFIIASKTFTTLETMTNAHTARNWFLSQNANENDIPKHFVALSTNKSACKDFGIPSENMFEFWNWVGGRYSLWSAIGLSIALAIGWTNFEELLHGAYEIDRHFEHAPLNENIPVIYALIGNWYRNFWDYSANAVIPYSNELAMLPEFLQQLDMESNGKYVNLQGEIVDYSTGQLIWGEAGTNSQHSFFQYLHQGTDIIPVDFIGFISAFQEVGEHHKLLLSNMIAQSEALMIGKSVNQVETELQSQGLSQTQIEKIRQHKVFRGNRPSNIFLLDKLTPRSMGKIISIFEHKVFVQGVLWNVNSFDQWGVELGKQLATKVYNEIDSVEELNHDNSTNMIINMIRNKNNV